MAAPGLLFINLTCGETSSFRSKWETRTDGTFQSAAKQRCWPSPRCHRDKRYWRCGLRSSSGGPGRTTWRPETRRGCHTLQEEGAGAHTRARSFVHRVLSSAAPCGDLHTHSSRHNYGNHLLKTQVVGDITLATSLHSQVQNLIRSDKSL